VSLDLAEAEKILEAAFGKGKVQLIWPDKPGRAFKVVEIATKMVEIATQKMLSQEYDLRTALQQAVKPVLIAAKRTLDAQQIEEFKSFMQFMRERFADEFKQWKEAQAAAAASRSAGSQPDSEQLVSLAS
jgi:hypothetical protein